MQCVVFRLHVAVLHCLVFSVQQQQQNVVYNKVKCSLVQGSEVCSTLKCAGLFSCNAVEQSGIAREGEMHEITEEHRRKKTFDQ